MSNSKNNETVLEIENLVSAFQTEAGLLKAVDGVSLQLKQGSILGIVGESGCGKSVTALSIMRLLPKPAGQYLDGKIIFRGTDILKLPSDRLHQIRGNKISMIFQEPMTALNPVYRIGKQLAETFELHQPELTTDEILQACIEILDNVGIPDPEKRLSEYPHQLSGGMRQRVMIGIALSCRPDILIADEPTTALDVTIQAQILELIKDLQKETGMSVIFITHDLGVIAQLCDEVVVMYAGKIAEQAAVEDIFEKPLHPYTKGLLSSIPGLEDERKKKLNTIKGMVPEIMDYPEGCRFQNRCPGAFEKCATAPPDDVLISDGHTVSCYLYQEQ